MKNISKKIYLGLILVFMYAPIFILIALSFNSSKSRAKWGGFTLNWYKSLFENEAIMQALYTTLFIALLSALIATIMGTIGALAINNLKGKKSSLALGITNIPMLNADIVTGISLMLLFLLGRFSLGFTTVLISHITFNIPYVVLSVLPRLKGSNKSTYEAALDLGATPFKAFTSVIIPEILPGIISGFMLSFTMSLDDFIITHFTKGPGIETLSTKIYTEVKKGIKPEMYALSTLIFLGVMILLILINNQNDSREYKNKRKFSFKKSIAFILIIFLVVGGIKFSSKMNNYTKNQVIVYNWGEYIDPDILTEFEEETGIHVVYEEFETNEIMYPKISSGATKYDVIFPSDYMIERMISEDLLAPLNYENIPNSIYLNKSYLKSAENFDPGNKYSLPYLCGTVGILYNTKLVDIEVDSWEILFDEKYKGEILMQDSVRDAFAVGLKYSGYSLNSKDLDELDEAKNLLLYQKPLVQAYVVDQVRDKMIGGEAALGVIYSGEAAYTKAENENLEYVVPKEGSNVWIDGVCIPKNCSNKENAETFINYLCRPDVAYKNFMYTTYTTPNDGAIELIEDEELKNNKTLFPNSDIIDRCETYSYLGDKWNEIYNDLWKDIKSK